MTTQISELGWAQRRGRAVAPVSDGAAVTTVEQYRQIALTQQEACRRSAVARSSSWRTPGRTREWWRRRPRRLFPVNEPRCSLDDVTEYAVGAVFSDQ